MREQYNLACGDRVKLKPFSNVVVIEARIPTMGSVNEFTLAEIMIGDSENQAINILMIVEARNSF